VGISSAEKTGLFDANDLMVLQSVSGAIQLPEIRASKGDF